MHEVTEQEKKDTYKRIIGARTGLIMAAPFFGSLALKLRVIITRQVPTMGTDGTHLYVSPDFVASLNNDELKGVIAHEVLHCTNGHPWRESGREHEKWNVACDFAINPIIVESGMTLPSVALNEPKFAGKSAEYIYNHLPPSIKMQGGCGIGEVMSPGSGPGGTSEDDADGDGNGDGISGGQPKQLTQDDWKIATVQAASTAKMIGKFPGALERMISEIVNPKVDWKAALQNILQQALAKDDYSWTFPNTRHIGRGLYMPSLRSEKTPPLVCVVDTSGSIGAKELNEFAAEITAIAGQVKPEKIYVLYVDTEVAGVEEYYPGETIEMRPKGGGGTNMPVAFDYIAENSIECAACVICTDGMTPWGEEPDGGYRVVWAINSPDVVAPYGTTLNIS